MRRRVAGGYALRNGHTVGFKLAGYDDHRRLTIDPSLLYSTYLGGSNQRDEGFGIARGLVGQCLRHRLHEVPATFRPRRGRFRPATAAAAGSRRVRQQAEQQRLGAGVFHLPRRQQAARQRDYGHGIALDSAGNAYVTGSTDSSDFPTTAGAFQTILRRRRLRNAFVSKLNRSGSALVYSTYLGGSTWRLSADGIALDSSGNAYVTGEPHFRATFRPRRGRSRPLYAAANGTAFVSKLNSSGSALVYSTYLGGSNFDVGDGIALDSSGNAYVTGGTYSSDFPTTAGAFQTTLRGVSNAFVSKLNSSGSALVYSTYLGGSYIDGGGGIALDVVGQCLRHWRCQRLPAIFRPRPGAFQTTSASVECVRQQVQLRPRHTLLPLWWQPAD